MLGLCALILFQIIIALMPISLKESEQSTCNCRAGAGVSRKCRCNAAWQICVLTANARPRPTSSTAFPHSSMSVTGTVLSS